MELRDAIEARWACKLYDAAAPLTRDDEDAILEAGRLTPTSFGLEHWRFVSVRDEALKMKLFGACFMQEGVRTAPLTVIALVRTARFYAPDSDFVKARAARFPGGHPVFVDDYRGYYEFLSSRGELEYWARSQAYLACAAMMYAAADRGYASCAIEGYDEAKVMDALSDHLAGFDRADWRVGILCTFGRPGEPRRERIREPLEELVTRI